MLFAADGAEAITTITQTAPDLVFLDLNMPRGGRAQGTASFAAFRHSARDHRRNSERYLASCGRMHPPGAADYITKPYEVEQLRTIVQRLERRRQPSPSASTRRSVAVRAQVLAAHLLGFVNREGGGQYGVEQAYQSTLAGEPRCSSRTATRAVSRCLTRRP